MDPISETDEDNNDLAPRGLQNVNSDINMNIHESQPQMMCYDDHDATHLDLGARILEATPRT